MNISRLGWWPILFLGVIGLLIAIPLAYFEFGHAGLEALSIITTSLLTLGLVILYQQQHYVLRDQQLPQLEISEFYMVDDFEFINISISNVGGGPATSMALRIDFYELNGDGPIRTAQGGLRRIEPLNDGSEKKTRASSIRPSEIRINFEAESKGVLGSRSRTQNQDTLASIVGEELDKNRDVIYGKVLVEYINKFSEKNEYEADFSLKFTRHNELKYEIFDFRPWADDYQHPALGG